jgi:predicted Zn-dependent protease with MMP-like domain
VARRAAAHDAAMRSRPDLRRAHAPTPDDLAAIGEQVLRELPEPFRDLVGDVPVRVQDFPDEATLADLELDEPFDLLGLYHGVPLGERLGRDVAHDVDMIFLYRRPLLDFWCAEPEMTLEHIVRHVLIHEIGHHFGLSDADMERIEAEAD